MRTLVSLISAAIAAHAVAAEPTLMPDPGGVIRKEPFALGLGVGVPWGGHLVMSLPEWGFCKEGAATLWSYKDGTVSQWSVAGDGKHATMSAESTGMPGIVLLGDAKVEAPDKVRLEMTIDNRTDAPVGGFVTSFCSLYRLATGFPSYKQGFPRTFVVIGGKTLALADTKSTDPASLVRGGLVSGTEMPRITEWTRAKKGDIPDKLDLPLIVLESTDGTHRIAISWTPAGQMLSNSDNPCMHCDPRFADAPAHGKSVAHGLLWFTDEKLEAIVAKFVAGEIAADPGQKK